MASLPFNIPLLVVFYFFRNIRVASVLMVYIVLVKNVLVVTRDAVKEDGDFILDDHLEYRLLSVMPGTCPVLE